MKKLFFGFFLLLSLPLYAARITLTSAQETELRERLKSWWHGPVNFSSTILQSEVVAWSDVENVGPDKQKMIALVAGLHPRSCAKGLRRISRYEDYHQHMSFVKESTYKEATTDVRFLLEHMVLPFPMVLAFKLPRIQSAGETQFEFTHGIFKDLKGTIRVAPVGNRCLYFLRADWLGQSTGLAPVIVETFAQTLVKIGLEHLIRVSSI